MTHVNFGDSPDSMAWRGIGFDLDKTCTASSSAVACAEGVSGIDNSFGANICAMFNAPNDTADCSTDVRQVYLVTDAGGSGTLAVQSGDWRAQIPIVDAYVTNTGGAGMLGAVVHLDDLLTIVDTWQLDILTATQLCSHAPIYSEEPIVQAADMHVGVPIDAGRACNAISIGMQFFDAVPFTGPLPAVPPNQCTCGLIPDGGVGCWAAEASASDAGIE
jgi:hypothetical protein